MKEPPQNIEERLERGESFSRAGLRKILFRKISFRKGNLKAADLRKSRLEECDLSSASLTTSRLDQTEIVDSTFEGAHLEFSCLQQAKMEKSGFSGSSMVRVDMSFAVIKGCRFDKANLSFADCESSRWEDVEGSGAFMPGINLQKAVIKNTTFRDCDFTDASMIGTSFENVSFVDCRMEGAIFERVRGLSASDCENLKNQGASVHLDRLVLAGEAVQDYFRRMLGRWAENRNERGKLRDERRLAALDAKETGSGGVSPGKRFIIPVAAVVLIAVVLVFAGKTFLPNNEVKESPQDHSETAGNEENDEDSAEILVERKNLEIEGIVLYDPEGISDNPQIQPLEKWKIMDYFDIVNNESMETHQFIMEGITWLGKHKTTYLEGRSVKDDGYSHAGWDSWVADSLTPGLPMLFVKRIETKPGDQISEIYIDGEKYANWTHRVIHHTGR